VQFNKPQQSDRPHANNQNSVHLNVITQHLAMALGTTLSETFSSCMCDTNQQARENKSFALLENHNRDSNHN
jgi:hypothetical protein